MVSLTALVVGETVEVVMDSNKLTNLGGITRWAQEKQKMQDESLKRIKLMEQKKETMHESNGGFSSDTFALAYVHALTHAVQVLTKAKQ